MREFGGLEARIMDVLWSAPSGLTVRQVLAELGDRSAYTTVLTVTERLRRKGWLSREASGRAFRYAPLHPKAHYTAKLLEQALATSSDRTAALVRFAGELSREEADALVAALDRPRAKPAPRGRRRRAPAGE